MSYSLPPMSKTSEMAQWVNTGKSSAREPTCKSCPLTLTHVQQHKVPTHVIDTHMNT